MTNYDEPITISHGMDVVGADGEKVGDISDMRGDYVVVSKGFFFPTDYFIPTSAINSVSDGKVYLNVTRDEALNQGWDTEPESAETTITDMPITDAGLQIQNPVPQAARGTYDSDPLATDAEDDVLLTDGRVLQDNADLGNDAMRRDEAESITIPVVEEELTATKHEVERGEVEIHKMVTSEEQTLEVPVTEEQVHVTRRLVDRDAPVGEQTFEEITIDIPVHGEEVDLEKRARVVEELEVTKEATTETERVTGTVRREDVEITDSSRDVIEDTSTR